MIFNIHRTSCRPIINTTRFKFELIPDPHRRAIHYLYTIELNSLDDLVWLRLELYEQLILTDVDKIEVYDAFRE